MAHIVYAAVSDFTTLVWDFVIGTIILIKNLIFVLPTHILFAMAIGFLWMLVRDTVVYVSLYIGILLGDILMPVQAVIDGINFVTNWLGNVGSSIGNWFKSTF